MIRIVFVLLALGLGTRGAAAMTYSTVPFGEGKIAIIAVGPIVAGDDLRLHRFAARLPAGVTIAALVLSSPGGLLSEAVDLSATVRNSRLATGVVAGQ